MSPEPPADVVATLRAAGCVFAADEARLLVEAAGEAGPIGPTGAAHGVRLAALVARRAAGEPLEQVLGWAEFRGLRVVVAPGVFVPRRRTGLLVETGLQVAADLPGRIRVVDLCCGSGAVGAAFAAELRTQGRSADLELHAADIDPAAVTCARRNLTGVGQVHDGDLYAALPTHLRGRVDLLLANAPYVPTEAIGAMPREARDHEPATALDGGADGLDLHRRIAADAGAWLSPRGYLLIETSRVQAAGTTEALRRAGLAPRVRTDDDLDATIVVGRRPRL